MKNTLQWEQWYIARLVTQILNRIWAVAHKHNYLLEFGNQIKPSQRCCEPRTSQSRREPRRAIDLQGHLYLMNVECSTYILIINLSGLKIVSVSCQYNMNNTPQKVSFPILFTSFH